MAESMPVWGYVESGEALASVKVNDIDGSRSKQEEKGVYRFETESPDKLRGCPKGQGDPIKVTAVTIGKRKGR